MAALTGTTVFDRQEELNVKIDDLTLDLATISSELAALSTNVTITMAAAIAGVATDVTGTVETLIVLGNKLDDLRGRVMALKPNRVI